jgi:hypothetical protein
MKEKIAKLIDLKTLVTLGMTIGLLVGFFMDKIEAKEFMTITVMVFTYYFSRRTTDDVKDVVAELVKEEPIDVDLTEE